MRVLEPGTSSWCAKIESDVECHVGFNYQGWWGYAG
jgi:hypothetical protein